VLCIVFLVVGVGIFALPAQSADYPLTIKSAEAHPDKRDVAVTMSIETEPEALCEATAHVSFHGITINRPLPRVRTSATGGRQWEGRVDGKIPVSHWQVVVTCSLAQGQVTAERSFVAPHGVGPGRESQVFVPGSVKTHETSSSARGGNGGGAGSLYPRGECTWYVATRRPDLPYFAGGSGNARNWIASAQRDGLPIGREPVAGAVAVFLPGQYKAGKYGHVAYVEAVYPRERKMLISEYNFSVHLGKDRRTISWAGLRFIYGGPSHVPVSPAQSVGGVHGIAGAKVLRVPGKASGGHHSIDFWRVQLTGGDRIVVSVKAPSADYYFDLYSPGTNGANFKEDAPVVRGSDFGEGQVILQAPYTGNFVLAVCENTDNGDCSEYATSGTRPMEPYTFQTALEGVPVAAGDAETRASESIAAAPAMNPGQGFEAGGGEDIDFWHVQLTGGDQMVVSVNAPNTDYYFELYSPETSDSTLLEQSPVDRASVYGEGQVILQAPYTGDFVLAVCENTTEGDCSDFKTSGTRPMEPYTFQTALEGEGVAPAVGSAEARASENIESAPSMTVGTFEAGGGESVDFWRVQLAAGNRMVLSVNAPGGTYYFDLYPPGTNGSNFLGSPFVEHVSVDGEGQVVLEAPSTGDFLLAVCENTSDGDCRGYPNSGTRPMNPYTFQTQLET
jgi:surface antigen